MNEPQKKVEKPKHPITGKPINTRANEPTKNISRQVEAAQIVRKGEELTGEKLIDIGYSPSTAENPGSVKSSKSFMQLLDEFLPDDKTLESHVVLLNARKLDHMTFPSNMEDNDIGELLASVNCVLRKVVHGVQAKHAYFWSRDNRALKDALDMVYKLKGKYAPEKFEDVSKYSNLSTADLVKRKKAALEFLKKKPPALPAPAPKKE